VGLVHGLAVGARLGVVTTTSLVQSVLNWLRAGYPEGVPGPDRVPLLALLRCTPLTEEQIKEVVHNITATDSTALADGEIGDDEIAEFIKASPIPMPDRRTSSASLPDSRPRVGRSPASTTSGLSV
jgi:Protein of unknown function (DUF3349)